MKSCISLTLLFLLGLTASAKAESLPSINRGMSYYEVKTLHLQWLAGNPAMAERVDVVRSIVSASPYGNRGLTRIFGNFEGRRSIDPRIPGVEDSILKLMSPSRAQAKGYVREVLYATGFHNDPRFQLVAMNEKLHRSWGNTDADILFRYGRHGLPGRIEVKDVSLSSQASGMRRIKRQIDKMAKEYGHTGHLQAWVNRREVHHEVKEYARNKGIPVFEKVSTSQIGLKNSISDEEVRNQLALKATGLQGMRAIQGGSRSGFGLWLLWDSAPVAWSDLQAIIDPNVRAAEAWRSFGEHGSYITAGSAMTISGAALLSSQYEKGLQGKLYRLSRIGGPVSLAALASGEAFMIWRYRAGDVSAQEFWTSQWIIGGSAAGGFVGAWTGGIVGSLTGTPLGPTIGAGIGGISGAWLAGEASQRLADRYYDWKFSALDERFAKFVYEHYGVN